MTTKYTISVDLPTIKEFVEVVGLGLFKNHETTELTDEQVEHWFNRPRSAGGDPFAVFPNGITVKEVSVPAAPEDETPEDETPEDTGKDDV